MTIFKFASASIALPLCATLAQAQLHDGDIILTVESGRIVTGTTAGGSLEPARVWGTAFGSFDFTDSPGFDSPSGTFAAGSQIGFNVRRALRHWNGNEFPMDPSGIPAETLQIRKAGFGTVVTPTSDVMAPGFGIPVSASGEFHQHVGYTLQPPRGAGIYLLELELWSTQGGIGTSEPLWIVFNNDLDAEELEEATQWVLDSLAGSACPADVNGDTTPDILDFLDFLDSFGGCDGQPAPCTGPSGIDADFNGDTIIDILDFLDFMDAFGTGCA